MTERQDEGVKITYNRMPQWELAGSAYLITWCVHEAQPELTPAERSLVAGIIQSSHPARYFLYAWVVMNDHVHVLCQPEADEKLAKLLHSLKSFSANRLQRQFGRSGSMWQKDSHTRIIRSEKDLREKASYILSNPQRRWPELVEYELRGWNWRS